MWYGIFVIYSVRMKSFALIISSCVALHYALTPVSSGDDQISNFLHLSIRVRIGVNADSSRQFLAAKQ